MHKSHQSHHDNDVTITRINHEQYFFSFTLTGNTAIGEYFWKMEDTQDLNLTFSGCGFLGIYHIGVMSCLKQNAAGFLRRVKCFGGASAGAFAAVGLVVDLDISEVAESVIRLAKRAKSLSLGPLHPSFQIVRTIHRAFEKMLPENAHELASGRLHISLTHVPDCQNVIISEFYSKEDLIEVS